MTMDELIMEYCREARNNGYTARDEKVTVLLVSNAIPDYSFSDNEIMIAERIKHELGK